MSLVEGRIPQPYPQATDGDACLRAVSCSLLPQSSCRLSRLLGPKAMDGVAQGGFHRLEAGRKESKGDDECGGAGEEGPTQADPVGVVVQPFRRGQPGQGDGQCQGEGDEPEKVTGQQGDDGFCGGAKDLANSNLFGAAVRSQNGQ